MATSVPPPASDVHGFIRDVLSGRRLVVVSNREPYEHVLSGTGTRAKQTVGGLTSALDPVLQAVGGTWVAWGSGDADRQTVDARDRVMLPPGKEAYRLRRIWLSPEEVEGYYEGHSNQMLWPLCHLETDKARFYRHEWDAYQEVNERFAKAAEQEAGGQGAVVWFQDYHLALAPAMLRARQPDATILQFWHIPWPPWEIFRQHPERRAILEGLLGCDLVGMHINLYCQNFLECVQRELALPVDLAKRQVILGDRVVRVRALPIGIDAAAFDALGRDPAVHRSRERFRARYGLEGKKVGLSVERADYTKGILLRLRALDLLFRRHPEWKERFTFLQVTPSSRETIAAYRDFARDMQWHVRKLNATYGTDKWKPVVQITTARSREELVALFLLADMAVVSVRYDGMNLVAKEFAASRVDERGTLLLSEFAGAAEELPEALLINPYDVEGFAEALHQGLTMDAAEQQRRMRRIRTQVSEHAIFRWIDEVFREVAQLGPGARGSSMRPLLSSLEEVRERMEEFRHVVLFCDYDGVLSPTAPRPSEAHLDPHVRELLIKLRDSASVLVSVVSGRALDDLVELVRVERLTYAGNHGLEISGPRARRMHPDATRFHAVIRELYEELRREMRPFPGVIVEDKQLGVAVHFRLADPHHVPLVSEVFYRIVGRHAATGLVRVTTGKRVLEVRPRADWDKGKAVLWLLENIHGPNWRSKALPLYLGDDETDEDAFRALHGSGLTVFVGDVPPEGTLAHYRLDGQGDVPIFLDWLTHVRA